jgi:hypothetical protein
MHVLIRGTFTGTRTWMESFSCQKDLGEASASQGGSDGKDPVVLTTSATFAGEYEEPDCKKGFDTTVYHGRSDNEVGENSKKEFGDAGTTGVKTLGIFGKCIVIKEDNHPSPWQK